MRVPLKVQVVAIATLFVAALVLVWSTSAAIVARERRRVEAKVVLTRAGIALAERGAKLLANLPRDFDTLGPEEWDDLDRGLSRETAIALKSVDGVEGGFFVRDHKRFLG